MGGEESEDMGVEQYWVCSDVKKEYCGEEDERVLWPHRPKKHGRKIDTGKIDRRQAARRGRPSKPCYRDISLCLCTLCIHIHVI